MKRLTGCPEMGEVDMSTLVWVAACSGCVPYQDVWLRETSLGDPSHRFQGRRAGCP